MKRPFTPQIAFCGKGQFWGPSLGPAQRSRGGRHMTSDLPRISTAQSRRFDPRALSKCPAGSARVGATNALSFLVPDGSPAASLAGWSRWAVDFARRRRPGPGPRGKGAGQKERNRLADSCARRSQPRLHRRNHQVGCGVPSTGVLLRSQGCHTGVLRCEVPGDLGGRVLGGSLENTPSRHRATRLTSCSSASTPRAERTKPRSGRSADTDAPTPCAGLLVLVLTFDGNSAMALGSLRRSGRAPGAAPGLQLRLPLWALRGISGLIRQVRDAPPHDALGLAPL